MRYSLRSLMIFVLVLPPLLAAGWFGWKSLRRDDEVIWEEIETEAPYFIPPHRWDFDTDEEYETYQRGTR